MQITNNKSSPKRRDLVFIVKYISGASAITLKK